MGLLERAKRQGGRYLNPVPTVLGGFGLAFKVLPLYFKNKAEREPKVPLGPFRTDVRVYRRPPESGLRVTWFGHSSMLLEIDGVRILVDPIWEERASPAQWFGPQRFFAPTMPLEQMPELDAVLISHDHYDHLGALDRRAAGADELDGEGSVGDLGRRGAGCCGGLACRRAELPSWTGRRARRSPAPSWGRAFGSRRGRRDTFQAGCCGTGSRRCGARL